ncbi:hypothetical protein BDY21DRAFT_391786 [Lineolata rhizophorae]|uniref:Uncharacterized protein n=1 Tax=Lineolata rhizophorae TaxID=578093 RepID=A0A6A6P0S9_9PEZI|nr:hypothetical protein BDY21DRAFT_391786 [Lineolata rhizophorae]
MPDPTIPPPPPPARSRRSSVFREIFDDASDDASSATRPHPQPQQRAPARRPSTPHHRPWSRSRCPPAVAEEDGDGDNNDEDVAVLSRPASSSAPSSSDDDTDAYTDTDVDTDVDADGAAAALPALGLARPPSRFCSRVALLAALLAVVVPLAFGGRGGAGAATAPAFGAEGGVVAGRRGGGVVVEGEAEAEAEGVLVTREDSPTDVCKRWSHQSAIVNGTMYIYGGRMMTDSQQDSDTWVNDFVTLDLARTWQIGSPSLTGLPRPSGPPAVANGYLWASRTQLFLYGGEFSDNPPASPSPFALWEYDIPSSSWTEHADPQTDGGVNAVDAGQDVERSAEGAGFGVAALGRGWYFGGHLDGYTTAGWSQSVPRIYLTSLLEFTLPGFSNGQVDALEDGDVAGEDGAWRNITEGGLQDTAGFPERADGLLVYVPGFGDEGILLGLAGGTNETFTQMNVIDIYDIATSRWYKQGTTGSTPKERVNPCAVVAAAPDGSSYNMYMFGGQNLIPYGEQVQYDDMWILSLPSFTWIEVDMSDQSVPPARAGHSCHLWDGQMVIVGGYVGQDLSCDSPGIYVFNASSLHWETQFTALSGGSEDSDSSSDDIEDGDPSTNNPFSQQEAQRGEGPDAGLEGCYGYRVPDAVISAIGGGPTGGATVTAPVQEPTDGPLATGHPVTYTVTESGVAATYTSYPGDPGSNSGDSDSDSGSGRNIGAIIAGTIAGVLAVVAGYFAFCAYVYRKRVQLYKAHVAAAQRHAEEKRSGPGAGPGAHPYAAAVAAGPGAALFPPSGSSKTSSDRGTRPYGAGTSSEGPSAGTGPSGAGGASSADPYADDGASSSNEDLLAGQEPSFWGSRGVLLNPRRSLRVINRD